MGPLYGAAGIARTVGTARTAGPSASAGSLLVRRVPGDVSPPSIVPLLSTGTAPLPLAARVPAVKYTRPRGWIVVPSRRTHASSGLWRLCCPRPHQGKLVCHQRYQPPPCSPGRPQLQHHGSASGRGTRGVWPSIRRPWLAVPGFGGQRVKRSRVRIVVALGADAPML